MKEVGGQPFIAAKPYKGHPYFGVTSTLEVMSDEEYPTKEADAALIVEAVNSYDRLKRIERLAGELTELLVEVQDDWPLSDSMTQAAIVARACKIQQEIEGGK